MTDFTPDELNQMDRYCIKYRDLVRSGETPTPEQDKKFMRYQAVCYKTEVAYER